MTLTKEGKVVLLVLAGFALGALNTGTNLLYVLTGALLNVYALSLWVAGRALRSVELERAGPAEVVAGHSVEVRYRLEAKRGLGQAVCVAEVPPEGALEDPCVVGFAGLPAGTHTANARLVFTRRGRFTLPELRVSCRAPFGLIERTRQVSAPWHVVVLPAPRVVRADLLEAPDLPAEALARRWRGLAQERRDVVRTLRDYTTGDDQRAVHWRSSARRGQLVVKEFERTAPDQALVVLDLARVPGPGGAEVEEAAVTLAASLQASLVRSGQRTALGLAGADGVQVVPPTQRESGLRRGQRALALIRPGDDPDLVGLVRAASNVLQSARVFLVTTRGPRAELAGRARVMTIRQPADAEACYRTGEGA